MVVTATTYFHRFFMRQSMVRYHVYVCMLIIKFQYCHNKLLLQDIAATCLFVATKVEECTRRLRDIVIACAQKGQKNDKLKLEEDSKVREENLLSSSIGKLMSDH